MYTNFIRINFLLITRVLSMHYPSNFLYPIVHDGKTYANLHVNYINSLIPLFIFKVNSYV